MKGLLRVGELSASGRAKGSDPPARPPGEFLGRRRPNRPQEATRKLEASGFRRLGRRLDKSPGCRGSVPLDPHRAGHRCDSQLAEVRLTRSIGEGAFRLSLSSMECTLRFFGGDSHGSSQNGIAREAAQREDGHIVTRYDVHGAPWAPYLDEPGILPSRRRYMRYARVEGFPVRPGMGPKGRRVRRT